MLRRAATANAAIKSCSDFAPTPSYSHVSTYRSSKIELQLYSPILRTAEDRRGPVAAFIGHSRVSGKVILDPSCYPAGHLRISIEGALLYPEGVRGSSFTDTPKYVFLSLQKNVKVSNSEPNSPISSIRGAFARRPSISGVGNPDASSFGRSHPFDFNLPQSDRPGEEMPSTFTPTHSPNSYKVIYKVIAYWQPNDPLVPSSHLEVPFFLQQDVVSQCVDGFQKTSWLEMPLKSDRPLPFRSAITIPMPMTFSRSSFIPYFVVFTTTPRSSTLAREITTDATISVSLIRQVVISEQNSPPPGLPLAPSLDSSEPLRSRWKHLRHIGRSQSKLNIIVPDNKPLPEPPVQKSFSEVHTIHKDMCIGFPKRPRHVGDDRIHPSPLKAMAAFPDGLHKTRVELNVDMLPSVDWAGVNVKYYLDVSVLFGPDNLRARIPIRIF